MFKRVFLLASLFLMLGSAGNAADIQWTGLGPDHLWSTPANWDLGTAPTPADEVRIDVPAAATPNGPVIQEGIAAEVKGIFTEAAGESTLTMTGGSLVAADYIWWGDGPSSFPIWTMSGGTVTVTNEFELGWGGGAGTVIMTGGTISAGEVVIPTASGAFGKLFLNGGTYSVTKPGGLKVNDRGQIDITAGTLVIEGDETVIVNDLITSGRITAHGGSGKLNVDYNQSNAGKTTVTAVQKVIVLSEGFEGLPLGPNVDEALAGAQVWTDTPPAGWTVDESGVPGIGDPATDGVTEWAGWAFANKDWWVQTAGDQRRSEFTLGQGTVAVADPDEWDDADHPGPNSDNPYDTWLITPAVDISGVESGSLQLKFDSSWRPEYDNDYHQTANITVSFDGAAPIEVLHWDSNELSPKFKPDTSTNETIVVDLANPVGAKSMIVTFGLFDAGNDWWWAIDNVEVTGNPLPEPLDPGIDGLMASYALDNDVLDGSGNGNNGTIVGNPTFVEGVAGMALQFDGDDYVETGNAQNLANWTISAWVKSPAAPAAASASGPVHREKNFQFNWNHTSATFSGAAAFRVGGTWHAAKYEPVQADTWYHLTATYDGEDLKAYRDGVLITTNSAPSGPPDAETGTLKLGRHATSATQYFTGTVDEAAIYSRALSEGEILYLAGQRLYSYDGDAAVSGAANNNDSLDGTWDHNNGSDTWDGSGIAQAAPGGASALVEDGVTFLRIQDPGDPRDYGMPDPSNRKVYFTHTTDVGLDGVRLEVRARIATTAPLDDQHPDGGAGIKPWPAEGIGSHIRDDGKGMFGIAQDGLGIISFSLAQPGEAGFENAATDVLVMNNLVGAAPSGDVDTGAAATAVNMLAVDDATQWNTFVIDIVAGGTGTHVVSVSANGKPAQSFDVTVGTGLEAGKGSYITLGSSGTGPLTAFDIDYISVSRPIPVPEPQEPEIVNLLANGGFEDGVLEPWSTYGTVTTEVVRQLAGAVVPEGPIEGSHCLHVTVPAAGANFWDAGLQHPGHVFKAGKKYTLSVWLKCKEGTLQINLKPELAADPWTGYGDQVVTITDQWAQYTITTPGFTQDASPGSITFHIAFAAAEFWVDDARWTEEDYVPPAGGANELTNGNFEEGPTMPLDTWAPETWNVYGTHTIEVVSELTGAAVPEAPAEGTYCLHVTVPQAGANFWDVGLQHSPHTFKQGKKYTLSAWFKSKSGTLNVNMKPELAADPWTGFGELQITMTDQWAEYSTTTPEFAQDTSPGSLTFHIGFAAGDFWMDNVRWYEGDYVAP